MYVRLLLTMLGVLLLAHPAFSGTEFVPSSAAATTNNVVTSTIAPGKENWDPGDVLNISGDLHDNFNGPCYLGPMVANADRVDWKIDNQIVLPAFGGGQRFCGPSPILKTFYPGTDANGHFSVSSAGGGVSWQSGSGYDPEGVVPPGVIMRLEFWEGTVYWRVFLGDQSWGFPCNDAPRVYGVLASPDLNGDRAVDQSDLTAFAVYLGHPLTRDFGWQADYNHSGPPSVDGSDLAYFAARIGMASCSSQKAGENYEADIRNLDDPGIRELMARMGMTDADVIAAWDEMGLSYDHEAAVLAGGLRSAGVERRTWSGVKNLYH